MPRPKKDGAGPPKTRSRFGCWPCKARKVKCGEEKPSCKNCDRVGETCDYSIRLNWSGRSRTKSDDIMSTQSLPPTPGSSTIVFPSPEIFTGTSTQRLTTSQSISSAFPPNRHASSKSSHGTTLVDGWNVDPALFLQPKEHNAEKLASPNVSDLSSNGREAEHDIKSDVSSTHYLQTSWQVPSASVSHSKTISQGKTMDVLQGDTYPTFTYGGAGKESLQMSAQIAIDDDGYTMSVGRSKRIRLDSKSELSSSASQVAYEITSTSLSDDAQGAIPDMGSLQQPAVVDGRRDSVPVSLLLIDPPLSSRDAPDKRYIDIKESRSTFFGYDRGNPDLDVGLNDDCSAIASSPTLQSYNSTTGSQAAQTERMTAEAGGFYASPVSVEIPRFLLPLPIQLLNNQMNLLYFHHFLNHTAKILVPFDCPINPYRTVLPRMAVNDEDLLNLLLAYSACHRSRLLKHSEPETRIARYVKDVFPRLRSSLTKPGMISINNIATSIMLASLEIISPGAFGTHIQWHTHLAMAREMLIARNSESGRPIHTEESFFLARWFGYLDILGSLSRPALAEPLDFEIYWVDDLNVSNEAIDCLLGCTRSCMRLLMRVAKLVKEAETSRRDAQIDGCEDWSISPEIDRRASQLVSALYTSREATGIPCTHGGATISHQEDDNTDMKEILSTNELYHWAGVIQVLRRVHNRPKDSADVKHAVSMVLQCLETIRDGSPAEACLLFPIFTAACETSNWEQQKRFAIRISDAEEFGMKQVLQARKLVEKTWETGQPWVKLIHEEFIG